MTGFDINVRQMTKMSQGKTPILEKEPKHKQHMY